MLVCVRTTINLPDALAEAAKARAVAEGKTFTRIVEEGLRVVLERQREASPEPLPAYGALRDQAWLAASDSCDRWSVPFDAAVEQ